MTNATLTRRLASAVASIAITFTLFSAVVSNAGTPVSDSLLAMAPSATIVR